MRILILTSSMNYLSGSALYYYELARELHRLGHEVRVMSQWSPELGDGAALKRNLVAEGVVPLRWHEPARRPDLIIASHFEAKAVFKQWDDVPVINVIHSEYAAEIPLSSPQIKAYVAIRPSIKVHLVEAHDIPADKVHVIYNGIDTERFAIVRPQILPANLLVPCTLDELRRPFLQRVTDSASPQQQVTLMGLDFGAKLNINPAAQPYVKILPDRFDIQHQMAYATEVAGILLGRVNLEAAAMGISSRIYDPVTLTWERFDQWDEQYDIKNTTQQILAL